MDSPKATVIAIIPSLYTGPCLVITPYNITDVQASMANDMINIVILIVFLILTINIKRVRGTITGDTPAQYYRLVRRLDTKSDYPRIVLACLPETSISSRVSQPTVFLRLLAFAA